MRRVRGWCRSFIYSFYFIFLIKRLWVECLSMARETGVQSQIESYQRLKKWYLMEPCLTLSIIRYRSRVKRSYPRKEVAPFPTPRCSSYWKKESSGHSWLRSSTFFLLYIYIYIYIWILYRLSFWPYYYYFSLLFFSVFLFRFVIIFCCFCIIFLILFSYTHLYITFFS